MTEMKKSCNDIIDYSRLLTKVNNLDERIKTIEELLENLIKMSEANKRNL